MLGSGTQADPYIIETLQDLQDMNLDLSAYYELGNDIDAAETVNWNGGAGFLPVGDFSSQFNGSFDGKDYTISNLYINRPGTKYIGLFGYVIDNDTSDPTALQNVTLESVNITGSFPVGGLVGCLKPQTTVGHITYLGNCTVDGGSITATNSPGGLIGDVSLATSAVIAPQAENLLARNLTITSNYYAGGLIAKLSTKFHLEHSRSINNTIEGKIVGGLVGYLAGGYSLQFSECLVDNNTINGTVTDNMLGGLIGQFRDTYHSGNLVNNCYVLNSLLANLSGAAGEAGGLIGNNGAEDFIISNCYTVFTFSGIGPVYGCFGAFTEGLAEHCYWDSEISGVDDDNAPSGTTGLTAAQMKDPANFPNWDFASIWANDGVANGGYHYLQAFPPPVSMPFSYWNGVEWVTVSEVKYWNGSEWVPVNSISRWDGANWV